MRRSSLGLPVQRHCTEIQHWSLPFGLPIGCICRIGGLSISLSLHPRAPRGARQRPTTCRLSVAEGRPALRKRLVAMLLPLRGAPNKLKLAGEHAKASPALCLSSAGGPALGRGIVGPCRDTQGLNQACCCCTRLISLAFTQQSPGRPRSRPAGRPL